MSFFFNDTATTVIYTLSLHDALPISLAEFGVHRALLVAAGVTVINVLAENLLSPMMMGRGLNLSPTVVFLSFIDRKSTRLNSSHANISYAVFCLKKNNHSSTASPLTP